ncbi:MAG TPA: SDR family NAD(P)-dependent oxidoreductase [Spirochaetota bacterium]|nr:SDR family NAD(P)-dependent oxidoreductase [Spirochaetota bacterium]HOM10998.1 SDR family NAD(P)-dependent oxidoreductase [Spirochaetota bacterium]HPP50814.1 SDR family NAD(P)-dependent oxidoreductase [Spirochaetota bacterium]
MNDVIVITGIADGMGREVAKMLVKEGHCVAGFDKDKELLNSLSKELESIDGDKVYLEDFDITDRNRIAKFRDKVLEKFKKVDTVLSNVGIGFFGPFEEIDLEKALKCFEINVIGAAAIFKAFIPYMRSLKRGKLIAMSSLVGRIPFPFESIYTATKFALTGLIESIRYEVEPFGIKVALIEPAQVSTKFAAKIHVLPPSSSPYFDRVKRFINRDNELIKTAPDPVYAAKKIYNVVMAKNPRLYNQIDFQSTFFLWLNNFLPVKLRDIILINYMDIKPR